MEKGRIIIQGDCDVRIDNRKICVHGAAMMTINSKEDNFVVITLQTQKNPTREFVAEINENDQSELFDNVCEFVTIAKIKSKNRGTNIRKVKFCMYPVKYFEIKSSGSTHVSVIDPSSVFSSTITPNLAVEEKSMISLLKKKKNPHISFSLARLSVETYQCGRVFAPGLTVTEELTIFSENHSLVRVGNAENELDIIAEDNSEIVCDRSSLTKLVESCSEHALFVSKMLDLESPAPNKRPRTEANI